MPFWSLCHKSGPRGRGPHPTVPTRHQHGPQGYPNGVQGSRNEDISNVFLSLHRKRQTAFGLRLCSRIRGWASRFHSLSHHLCPWFFQRFFDVFWGPKKVSAARVGARGGTQLIDFKNNTLVYLYLLPSLGASTGSLVGSSLEPAAGFIGYRLCRRPLKLELSRISWLETHNGYLLARMGITVGSILEALGSLGSLLGRLWCHWGSTGGARVLVQAGAPI